MTWTNHFRKDIAYHALTAHEYDSVVVDPRKYLNELLFRKLDPHISAGSRMLDLGCGTGHSIQRFGRKFKAVLGVDHSEEMLNQATINLQAAEIHHATLINQDIFTFLDSAASQFDLVTSIGCLHHLPPITISILLKKVHRCLKNDGQLLLADPIAVDLCSQPKAVIEWNSASVMVGRQFSNEAEEADEAPLDYGDLCASLSGAGFFITYESRGWELFPHRLPATAEDKLAIEELHERYGESGNVLCLLCRKGV